MSQNQQANQLTQKVQQMAQQLQQKQDEMTRLNQKLEENTQVLKIIETLPKERKCHRLVGGILVEMQNEKVQSELASESEELKKMVGFSMENLIKHQKEFDVLRNQLTAQ